MQAGGRVAGAQRGTRRCMAGAGAELGRATHTPSIVASLVEATQGTGRRRVEHVVGRGG